MNPDGNTDLPQDRHSLIKKQLRTDHLNDDEKCAITELCLEFSDIFYLDGDILSFTSEIKHSIETNAARALFSKS